MVDSFLTPRDGLFRPPGFVTPRPDEPFEIWQAPTLRPVVVQWNPGTGVGFDWATYENVNRLTGGLNAIMRDAIQLLRLGVNEMTGQQMSVTTAADVSDSVGIVLVLRAGAPAAWLDDEATEGIGEPGEETNESYYIRSSGQRIKVIANRLEGLICAIPEILEACGYDILEMGPRWRYAPDKTGGLRLQIRKAARPSYLKRRLFATAGQPNGVGTLLAPEHVTVTPPDEDVFTSYRRWQIWNRIATSSTTFDPGHALQQYHAAIIANIKSTTVTEGFLHTTHLGTNAERIATDPVPIPSHIWINSDNSNTYTSTGGVWVLNGANLTASGADVSLLWVRQLILDDLVSRANTFFTTNPTDAFGFNADPEDGGAWAAIAGAVDPDWYADYRTAEDDVIGGTHPVHGFLGLSFPSQSFDGTSQTDVVHALADWLLREYDKVVGNSTTSAGKLKRDLVRIDLLSYNFHDVIPHFKPDGRIRIQIADYPKHRGSGAWLTLNSKLKTGQAFSLMFPGGFSAEYWIISLALVTDFVTSASVVNSKTNSPSERAGMVTDRHALGYRAISAETDFNYGKYGPLYTAAARAMWDSSLTREQTDEYIDGWLVRAFGAAALSPMRAYAQVAWGATRPVNGPNLWAECVQLLDEASDLTTPGTPERARIDDLKTHWRHYYFVDTGAFAVAASNDLKESMWRGQMGYQVALVYDLIKSGVGIPTNYRPSDALPSFVGTPARYSEGQTDAWWPTVRDRWSFTQVTFFDDTGVDVRDRVRVSDFGNESPAGFHIFNMNGNTILPHPIVYASSVGQEIGFYMFWPNQGGLLGPQDAVWGLELYADGEWQGVLTDQAISSVNIPTTHHAAGSFNVFEFRIPAPAIGQYKFTLSKAGNSVRTVDLNWDEVDAPDLPPATPLNALCYAEQLPGEIGVGVNGISWFYIPKGTTTLDMEFTNTENPGREIKLFPNLTGAGAATRTINVQAAGVHKIALNAGEDGKVARLLHRDFPYLYSVPMIWAKCPHHLLVPRVVAQRDGLTIV